MLIRIAIISSFVLVSTVCSSCSMAVIDASSLFAGTWVGTASGSAGAGGLTVNMSGGNANVDGSFVARTGAVDAGGSISGLSVNTSDGSWEINVTLTPVDSALCPITISAKLTNSQARLAGTYASQTTRANQPCVRILADAGSLSLTRK